MNKMLHSALVTTLGVIGLSGCDPAPPPNATVCPPVESKGIAAGGALADVVREEDPFARALKLAALLPVLGPEAVPEVKETLGNSALFFGATEMELLLRYWATHRPEEASRWAVDKSPTPFRTAAVYTAFPLWAKADPQAAVAATQEWSERDNVAEALQSALVLGWFAAGDPPELQQYIRDLGVGLARQRTLSTYVRAVIRKHGVEAVMRWAESVPDDYATYKTAVYRQVGFSVTMHDVEAGLRWCEAHCTDPFGKDLRNMIASAWAWRDPAAALAWLSDAAPEGQEKRLALRVAFSHWLQTDREAALDWMAVQASGGEPDPWLRQLYLPYARALAKESPADAIPWAERIELDGEREFTLIQVARAWRRVDEAACEAWLLQSSLSEEAREEVRALHPTGLKRNAERPPDG